MNHLRYKPYMNVNFLSLATIQLPRRFRCPQSRYPARISCLTFDLFVTVQNKRNIVFLRIQECLFPTIAITGLNGSKTEASSNILSLTVIPVNVKISEGDLGTTVSVYLPRLHW